MNWFEKLLPPKIKSGSGIGKRGVPEGLWRKCASCQAVLYGAELERELQVCPKCGHHMRIGARERLTHFFDGGEFEERVGAGLWRLRLSAIKGGFQCENDLEVPVEAGMMTVLCVDVGCE